MPENNSNIFKKNFGIIRAYAEQWDTGLTRVQKKASILDYTARTGVIGLVIHFDKPNVLNEIVTGTAESENEQYYMFRIKTLTDDHPINLVV